MKEIEHLNGMECEARGHVEIKYTDPTFGKVREKFEGDNHVFKDIVFCTNLQNLMLYVPLAITDRKSTPLEAEFMLARGKGIGYGIPGSATDNGLYKGSWVNNESYRVKVLNGGIVSKYTYQFYPNQAIGNIGSVALTNQFGLSNTVVSTPYKLAWGQTGYSGQYAGRGVLRTKNYAYGFENSLTESAKRIWKVKMNYPLEDVNYVNVASIVTDSLNWIYKITRDDSTGRMYVILLFATTQTVGRIKFYEFSDDTFTTLLSTREITDLSTHIHIYNYDPVGVYNRKISLLYLSSGQCYLVSVDMEGDNHSKANVASDFVNALSGRQLSYSNYYFVSGKYAYLGGDLNYEYPRAVFNLDTQSVETFFSTGSGQMGVHPYVDGSAVTKSSSSEPMEYYGAAAVYTVPDDAPQRPPGYGMTVSYELEIKY